jgi:hypothetical protein
MTDPPQHDQAPTVFGGPDPTRDIRLPPLPDRAPAAMPREWAASQPAASAPDFSAPPPDLDEIEEVAPTARAAPVRPPAAPPRPLPDQPTDELHPPRGRPRERTLAFASPEMAGGRPTPTVSRTPRRPRRWPWVLLTLLPILVITGAGIALVVILRGG